MLALSVEDNGIGIPADLQPHVFDLFTQADRTSDRAQGGLGIGLALVKNLSELHGGTISCVSAGKDQGSTFTVVLPRHKVKSDAALNKQGHSTATGLAQLPLRILVVDDNADAAQMLAMYLETLGHHVFVEHAPLRALACAKQEQPDVCILDIGLPEMDGKELARQLRAAPETSGALLIALTGYGQEQDRIETRAAGFDQHLVKPVDAGKLAALLERRTN
jgi:CheY-like chemotaxis protein